MRRVLSFVVALSIQHLLYLPQIASFSKDKINGEIKASDKSVSPKSPVVFEGSHTVSFAPYSILSSLKYGDGATSNEFSINLSNREDNSIEQHRFCVLCYPKGGGRGGKTELDGFLSGVLKKQTNVGVYLKYIPPTRDSCVDVTFSLVLKGKQQKGRKFDLEWSSGMRFVSPEYTQLRGGQANDFGTSIMQPQLLPFFLGVDENDSFSDGVLDVEVKMKIHQVHSYQSLLDKADDKAGLVPKDIRTLQDGTPRTERHDTEKVRVGKIIVPVLKTISERERMFSLGCYPGVEFRIMRIFDEEGNEIFGSQPGADYEIRPIYPLVQQLEREWPVRVTEAEIPTMLTQTMYNFVSAVGSLFTAVAGLGTAFAISLAISLYFIPSKSMEPNLKVGDVLLVEKVSSKLTNGSLLKTGDVVLFRPPSRLQDVIVASGAKRIDDRDLFVKRIAAESGDVTKVDTTGSVFINGAKAEGNRGLCDTEPLRLIEKYIDPREEKVPAGDIFVMGDCSDVSVDSRVWGTLSKKEVIGRPLLRLWPPARFGAIPDLPSSNEKEGKEVSQAF